ncbi:hypothetical protein [Xylophilus ampelinus]|uniref:Uncharacterized protein n=1 Tax=Xylophilus ampelinus TaxID=54067 RepID=A0A318SJM7_9BURK|nr:hypothetical protein [Xylophilus ampelinus]MCS4509306.1 hypothetical protein [Xylophilus ampelinus]PYE79028.1 hypothetical protein DFQ15_10315 [Xylophilus ampelinus]
MTSTSTFASSCSSSAKKSGAKPKKGLYANIRAKRRRIAAGSGETMREPHSEGAPTDASFRDSARTAKKPKTTRHHRGRRAKARAGRSRSRSR